VVVVRRSVRVRGTPKHMAVSSETVMSVDMTPKTLAGGRQELPAACRTHAHHASGARRRMACTTRASPACCAQYIGQPL